MRIHPAYQGDEVQFDTYIIFLLNNNLDEFCFIVIASRSKSMIINEKEVEMNKEEGMIKFQGR